MNNREVLHPFYNSLQWKRCRDAYKRKQRYICERCGNTSKNMIVHHRIHLSPDNVNDPSISLNFDNLELLCIQCHNKEHFGDSTPKRYCIDENGKIITIGE